MPSRSSLRPARRSFRPSALSRTALSGAAVGLVLVAGLTSTTAAFAAAGAPFAAPLPAVASALGSAGQTLDDISAEAHSALRAARATVGEASAIEAEVAASGLDLGAATSIDTRDLRSQIDRLSTLDVLPALLLPGIAADTADRTRQVNAAIDRMRDSLDAAVAQRAAEEAAAAAQRAAEEAAAKALAEAEAAAAAAAAALAAANTPEGAQATARQIAAADYGWGADQFSCLQSLWNKESNWNYQAYNDSSGATGIPQALPGDKMATAGSDWQSNATTQIVWGLGYIAAVYGTPCSAWGHSQATDWY